MKANVFNQTKEDQYTIKFGLPLSALKGLFSIHHLFVLIISSIMCAGFNSVIAQNQEHQRKYKLEQSQTQLSTEQGKIDLPSFSLEHTADYYSYDIYWDTPDLLLFKNHLSLRIRKVIKSEGKIEYKIQLKNEMTDTKSARFEVEDERLTEYLIQTNEGTVALTGFLDQLFESLEKQVSTDTYKIEPEEMKSLMQWVSLQSDGFIEPFQVLSDLQKPGITSEQLSQLRPTVFVFGQRKRLKVYTKSTMKEAEFSNNDPKQLQVAECSIDSVVSISLQKSKTAKFALKELEIEDKQKTPNSLSIDQLEIELEAFLESDLNPLVVSKYHQSIEAFYKKK
jgi:hypothetical protein